MKKNKQNASCDTCSTSFEMVRSDQKFCSKKCRLKSQDKRNTANTVLSHLSAGTMGAVAELMACTELMKMGWEVFRAVSPSSNCDILATKSGRTLRLEIRSGFYYTKVNGDFQLHYPTQRTNGKSVIVVTHTDNKIHYIGFEP